MPVLKEGILFYTEVTQIDQFRADSEAKETSLKAASTVIISFTRWKSLMMAHLGKKLAYLLYKIFSWETHACRY